MQEKSFDEIAPQQVDRLFTNDQVRQLRPVYFATTGSGYPVFKKHLDSAADRQLATEKGTFHYLNCPHIEVHTQGLRDDGALAFEASPKIFLTNQQMAGVHIAAVETAAALGLAVQNQPVDHDRLTPLADLILGSSKAEEALLQSRGGRLRRFGVRLIRTATGVVPPELLDHALETSTPEQLETWFESASTIALQLELGWVDWLAGSATAYLANLSGRAKTDLGLVKRYKEWTDALKAADLLDTPLQRVEEQIAVSHDIMQLVSVVGKQSKRFGKETTFPQLALAAKVYDDWLVATEFGRSQIETAQRYLSSGHIPTTYNPGPSSIVSEAPTTILDLIEPAIDTPEQVEALTNDQQIELENHLLHLREAQALLRRTWFNKAELKASGFHDLTHVLKNGGQGEGWLLQSATTEHAVWEIAGLLMRCNQLLQAGELAEARAILYGDRDLESAMATDTNHIGGFLHSKSAVLPRDMNTSETSLIESTLEMLRSNWNNYAGLIHEKWPNGQINMSELMALIFETDVPEQPPVLNLTGPSAPDTDELSAQEPVEIEDFVPNPQLREVALQLDWVVLPNGSLADIQRSITENYPSQYISTIDWRRIEDLVSICEAFGGVMYRSKDRTLGNTMPYFVVECEIDGKVFAIAENPQYGNATYLVRADIAAGDWREILEVDRQEARELGAHRVIHPKAEIADKHLERIYDKVQDLLTVSYA